MKLNRFLIILLAIIFLNSCKENKLVGIDVENNTPAVDQAGILIESIGIETLGGVFTPLLPSGTKQPATISQIFSTAADNQSQILVKIYRGNSKMVQGAIFLGSYQVIGILPAPRGVSQIEIILSVKDSKIKLFANNLDTEKEMKIIMK